VNSTKLQIQDQNQKSLAFLYIINEKVKREIMKTSIYNSIKKNKMQMFPDLWGYLPINSSSRWKYCKAKMLTIHLTCCYGMDLKCSLNTHVLKAWSPACEVLIEEKRTIRRRGLKGIQFTGHMPSKGTWGPCSFCFLATIRSVALPCQHTHLDAVSP
jgi:hypothetical protein